ncbi:MAG: PHP domain-containing protein [Syntrophobacteraceae bacterium]
MKEHRKAALILLSGLAVLTLLACLPYAPQGPFDARTYARLAGMRVEQHAWTAFIEPLFAPMRIVSGAPNFLVAALSLLLWVFVGAAVWRIVKDLRVREKKSGLRVAFAGILSALIATSSLLLLLFLFIIARVPGWRLVVNNPNEIVADLHSHTVISHDGLMSLKTNIDLHESCGYDVEAITEHYILTDHKPTGLNPSEARRLPGILSGVEVHTGRRAMAIAICRNTDVNLGQTGDTTSFVKRVHSDCEGVVLVVTLKNLKASDVAKLAEDGVDGFEIANCGHPGLPPALRRQVLATCRSHGLVLVADTDWHGWTGLTRTWNVIKVPGGAALSPSRRADAVLEKLREHDSADIIPVVAEYMGEPSTARAVFAPFVETVRYAMELSPGRVISWWVWVWVVFALWIAIEKKGFRAGDILLALLVGSTSVCLIAAGISETMQGMGTTAFGFHVGLITIGVGVIALGISTFRGIGFLKKSDRFL